jgi:hypothetical protein
MVGWVGVRDERTVQIQRVGEKHSGERTRNESNRTRSRSLRETHSVEETNEKRASERTLTRAPGLSLRLASVTGCAADERLRDHSASAAAAEAAAEAEAAAAAPAAEAAPEPVAPAAVEKKRALELELELGDANAHRVRAAETNRVSIGQY